MIYFIDYKTHCDCRLYMTHYTVTTVWLHNEMHNASILIHKETIDEWGYNMHVGLIMGLHGGSSCN